MAQAGMAAAGTLLAPAYLAAAAAPSSSGPAPGNPLPAKTYNIGLLEKWFFDGGDGGPLKYTPDQMAQTLDEIGLDLELTLRRNGHITPEKAPDELPAMVAALSKKIDGSCGWPSTPSVPMNRIGKKLSASGNSSAYLSTVTAGFNMISPSR